MMEELVYRIEQTALATEFSGVISIFTDTATVFNKAYGYRDRKNHLPNTTHTIFGIASGTKFFTALGIGVLINRGLISLDTAIGEIAQEYTGFVDERATIQHLLTHTSGIYDYYDEEIEQDFEHFSVEIPWYRLETPLDYYPLFQGQVMKFRPGERFSYSNGGYVFLGMLIEKLTGSLYRDFIREHVLQAANMPISGFYAFNDLPENTANGYLEDRKTTNIYQLPLRGGGDGGMYTTTDDLRSFWNSLFSHRILSAGLTATYLKTHCKLNDTTGYGCGIYKHLDDSLFEIAGSDAGVGFESWHVVPEKLTINILSNITNGEEAVRKAVLSHF
ncbi:MAG: class A beta-lactamase-related serine hydrolase [Chloroflexi bacterium]|nr:MAG: class A beta-lactamase-related serine hydrolase [Chloroflexota bacterium]